MNFILGCNYWASNAGTEMWRDFDTNVIEKDLKILSVYGTKYIRVFPAWRDFQPVRPNYTANGAVEEYVMENGQKPGNPYFLDEKKLENFSILLDICKKNDIKVIIGLVTGWMSGAMLIPSALYGKNLITDSTALYFEQLFIKGFVEYFKDYDSVYAWDLGNECNNMGEANRMEAAVWTGIISNAIKAVDSSRPVISGMHGLTVDGDWTIADQAAYTDILTTHPYPYFCRHTRIDRTLSLRTTLHATAESKMYSDIGNKPCLAEEIGTLGPMVCSEENSADFLRLNLFSLWANDVCGAMWWCAHDQEKLDFFPYNANMLERELGLLDSDYNAKPMICEIKKFGDFLNNSGIELPKAEENAVCILSDDQDHWGIAYMTYIMAKKAGLNLKFAMSEQAIPDSGLYLLPSINGKKVMSKSNYDSLKQKVYNGADLYISADKCFLQGFEELTGLKVIDSYDCDDKVNVRVDDVESEFLRKCNMLMEATTAEIIAYDNEGNPFMSVNKYGEGHVFFVNAPVENGLIHTHNAFDKNPEIIYKTLFGRYIKNNVVKTKD
ncbi:MAG: cellulase family glycosylhydrolase [Clostridia bacterium]|nr:cellulase family glycosylhydrolase [Clostridia bacterium]